MFIEVKRSKAGRWHVHAHIIAESKYLPQGELSAQWLAVTGDSPIVDVRMINSADAAASYVAKYGSKSFDSGLLKSPRLLAEVMTALKGARLCTTFGEWRGAKLTSMKCDEDTQGWQDLGYLHQFVHCDMFAVLAEQQPELALRIARWFKKRKHNESS